MSSVEAEQGPMGAKPSGIGQALLLYGICFVLVVFVGGPLQALSFRLGLVATLVCLMLVPAAVFIRSKGVGLKEGLRLRAVPPSVLFSSLLLGVGTWGIGMLVARLLGELGMKSLGQGLGSGMGSPSAFAATLLAAAVGPGICEEALFRGAIQGVMERKGKCFGVVATAFLFGMVHQTAEIAIPATLLGLFYGWVVIQTGSIIPAMVAHFANNAAAISFLYGLEGEDPVWLLPLCVVIGGAAVFAIRREAVVTDRSSRPSPLGSVPAALPMWGLLGCAVPLMLLTVVLFGLISTIPYFIMSEELEGGQRVMYAEKDTQLFKLMVDKSDARLLFSSEQEPAVGRLLELTDNGARIQDESGNEIEIEAADILGVVLSTSADSN